MNIKMIFILILALFFSFGCAEKGDIVSKLEHPECSGVERWATNMAFVHLKNSGITSNESLDFNKTKTTRLASEKMGNNLYVQIHFIVFIEKSGKKIKVITRNMASNEECSMSDVEVFVISKVIGK
ncbi:MAG: hypothetical protein L3J84_04230 [Gammaproteobacteria bacterium]|nr:hypothetical protein [Gammaproteobacteria bacterium]